VLWSQESVEAASFSSAGRASPNLGWLALQRRPDLRAEARKGWAVKDIFGVSIREKLFVIACTGVLFLLVWSMFGVFWALIANAVVYFAWDVARVSRGR
jgi:hypothetical protein